MDVDRKTLNVFKHQLSSFWQFYLATPALRESARSSLIVCMKRGHKEDIEYMKMKKPDLVSRAYLKVWEDEESGFVQLSFQ